MPGLDPIETINECATFERVGVTESQIADWSLPTRPTKKTDTRSKNFKGESVELDAIPTAQLHDLAGKVIEGHIDQHQLGVLEKAEAEERRELRKIAGFLSNGNNPDTEES